MIICTQLCASANLQKALKIAKCFGGFIFAKGWLKVHTLCSIAVARPSLCQGIPRGIFDEETDGPSQFRLLKSMVAAAVSNCG